VKETVTNPLPPYLRVQSDGLILAVRLQPRASLNQVVKAIGSELQIKVTAPPVDAAANEALLRLLADTLELPRNCVRLLRGHTSRHKTILLQKAKLAEVISRLPA
jgi:uncharacterized protein